MTHSFPTRRSSDLFPSDRSAPVGQTGPAPPLVSAEESPPDRRSLRTRVRLPIYRGRPALDRAGCAATACWTAAADRTAGRKPGRRSEEHTSELQSLMRISYAVFCLKKKKKY